MLLMYNHVLLKMSTWYSKNVEESNNIWRINNIQCITLVVLYGQFMMHGQRNIKLFTLVVRLSKNRPYNLSKRQDMYAIRPCKMSKKTWVFNNKVVDVWYKNVILTEASKIRTDNKLDSLNLGDLSYSYFPLKICLLSLLNFSYVLRSLLWIFYAVLWVTCTIPLILSYILFFQLFLYCTNLSQMPLINSVLKIVVHE